MAEVKRKAEKVASVYYGNAAGVPDSSDYSAEAKAILAGGSNRFHMAMAFIICAIACGAAFYGMLAVMQLLGFADDSGDAEDSNLRYFFMEMFSIVTALVLASPFFHGYKITAAHTAKTGKTDLTDMFAPFSSFSMLLASVYSGLASSGPAILTVLLYAFAVGMNDYMLYMCCIPFLVLMFVLFRRARRISRIHAFFPENGFRYARRAARFAPAAYRRRHIAVGASFIPQFMLAAVTLLITGIYNGFAQYSLASALTVADLKIMTVPRKDDIK